VLPVSPQKNKGNFKDMVVSGGHTSVKPLTVN